MALLRWLKNRRRRKILKQDFPAQWEEPVHVVVSNCPWLDAADLPRLQSLVQILVAEKNWEGCGGLRLQEFHKCVIASQIARLAIGFAEEYFDETKSILVYPHAYSAPTQQNMGSGVVVQTQSGRLGEAWYRGPVILSWQDVIATVEGRNYGRNVVIHEFVHKLDMRNGGHADGVPAIEDSRAAAGWIDAMRAGRAELSSLYAEGSYSVLDRYGTTSPEEFFAVASEAFFEAPDELQQQWPAVYEQLRWYFRSGRT